MPILETICNEFDVRKDMDNIKFINSEKTTWKQYFTELGSNVFNVCTMVKPAARGLLVGGVIGASYGLISGSDNISYDSRVVGIVLSQVDLYQYTARLLWKYFSNKYG